MFAIYKLFAGRDLQMPYIWKGPVLIKSLMNNARLTHAHGTVISILRELSLSPLGNLALDGDVIVLDKILHDTEKAPVVVVTRVFR